MSELLTATQVARHFQVQPETIREWARSGLIPQIRINGKVRRFSLNDVEQALRQRGERKGEDHAL
jgi:excisionase family DNA binding protein